MELAERCQMAWLYLSVMVMAIYLIRPSSSYCERFRLEDPAFEFLTERYICVRHNMETR